MAALLGLREGEFEETTPGYFADMVEAWEALQERETRLAEHANREAWERARLLSWYGVQIHVDKKDRQSLRKFMPLPWDEPEAVDVEKMRELAHSAPWIQAPFPELDDTEKTPEEIEKSYQDLLQEWQQ